MHPHRDSNPGPGTSEKNQLIVVCGYIAGDGVKFHFPMAGATTLLAWSLVDYRDVYQDIGELANMLNCIKWPLDYFIKCHVDDNILYGQVGLCIF